MCVQHIIHRQTGYFGHEHIDSGDNIGAHVHQQSEYIIWFRKCLKTVLIASAQYDCWKVI